MPKRCTFRSWSQVTLFSLAGITKANRNDRDALHVVEVFSRNTKPFPQTVPTSVRPRDSGLMRGPAGCLTNKENPGIRACRQQGPGAEWEMRRASLTSANILQDRE